MKDMSATPLSAPLLLELRVVDSELSESGLFCENRELTDEYFGSADPGQSPPEDELVAMCPLAIALALASA